MRCVGLILITLLGCEPGADGDASVDSGASQDAFLIADAESFDAEPLDANSIDAEALDAEPIDADPSDAEPLDAEPLDAEPLDAEPLDAEPIDADPSDAGEPDASPDAGVVYGCSAFPEADDVAVEGSYRVALVADRADGLNQPVAVTFAGGAFGGQLIVVSREGRPHLNAVDPLTGVTSTLTINASWPVAPWRLSAIAWDEDNIIDGNVYVADLGFGGDGDGVVFRVDPSGTASIAAQGPGPGLDDIRALEFSSLANYPQGLYISGTRVDLNGSSIGVLDAFGSIAPFSQIVGGARALAFDSGGLYGGNLIGWVRDGTVRRIDPSGAPGPVIASDLFLHALEFSPGGSFGTDLYVASALERLEPRPGGTAAPRLLTGFDLGDNATNSFAFTPDGNAMFAVDRFRNRLVCLEAVPPPACTPPSGPIRVSVSSAGVESDDSSGGRIQIAISADGRFVAFDSDATNLVANDTNADTDIFVYDALTATITRANLSSAGAQSSYAVSPALSDDGRYVAFFSHDRFLVPNDTNDSPDIFVHDRATGITDRAHLGPGGAQANGYASQEWIAISSDGRYVAFSSDATNLVAGDTNGRTDIFVHDRTTGNTERASVGTGGVQADRGSVNANISSDGRFVAFLSDATNLVPNDTNNEPDVFVRDRSSGVTIRVSVDSGGAQATGGGRDPRMSRDGRWVVFASESALDAIDVDVLTDVYVHDLMTGQTTLESVDSSGVPLVGESVRPSISGDGSVVAFESYEPWPRLEDRNLRTDLLVRDRASGNLTNLSINSAGIASGVNNRSVLSADGQYVAFTSLADNLVPLDDNRRHDVFRVARFTCP